MVRRPAPPGGSTPPTKKVPGPKFDLPAVLAVAHLANIGKKRAVREVANRLGTGEPAAEQFVRKKLSTLQKENYVESVEMDYDATVVADVYGVIDAHGGWYIKFYIEHGRVQVVSCHAPEHDMTCVDGTRIPKEQ